MASRSLMGLFARVPTALFPVTLGAAGLGASLRAAATRFEAPALDAVGVGVLAAAGAAWLVVATLYLGKVLRAQGSASADLGDQTTANLLAPGLMAAMVLGSQLAQVTSAGAWLWIAAVTCHGALLAGFVGRWVTQDFPSDALNPTWFLPSAGLMSASMTAGGFWPDTLTWMAFSAGFSFWLILLPGVAHRVIFEPALDPRLRPTLFILAAPFGLAANSMLNLMPDGPLAAPRVATYAGAFLVASLAARPRFLSGAGVTLSWWATTFPVATVATALVNLSTRTGDPIDAGLATAALGLAVAFTLIAVLASLRVAWRRGGEARAEAARELAAMCGESAPLPGGPRP